MVYTFVHDPPRQVSVQTSNVRGAGTQASAWVALYGVDADGQETTSGALQLSGSALLAMLSSLDSGEAGGGLSDAEVERMRGDLHSPQVEALINICIRY